MTEKLTELCDSIIAKAHEFVGVGDFSSVTAAAEALSAIAKCGYEHKKPSTSEVVLDSTSVESAESCLDDKLSKRQSDLNMDCPDTVLPSHAEDNSPETARTCMASAAFNYDQQIFNQLAQCGYDQSECDDDESDFHFLGQEWISTSAAAKFAGMSVDAIRNWCKNGTVLCKQDPVSARKVWLVCPRSIALRINKIPDPRLEH